MIQTDRIRSFLLILALTVFSFGIVTWASLKPTAETKIVTSNLKTSTEIAESGAATRGDRSPSSLNPASQQVQKNDLEQFLGLNHLVKIDLSCPKSQTQKKYVIKGGFIQLNGKSCLRQKSFQAIRILNQTNGYQASLFEAEHGEYKTDLIQLNEGINKIQIEYENSGGQKTELSVFVTSRRI